MHMSNLRFRQMQLAQFFSVMSVAVFACSGERRSSSSENAPLTQSSPNADQGADECTSPALALASGKGADCGKPTQGIDGLPEAYIVQVSIDAYGMVSMVVDAHGIEWRPDSAESRINVFVGATDSFYGALAAYKRVGGSLNMSARLAYSSVLKTSRENSIQFQMTESRDASVILACADDPNREADSRTGYRALEGNCAWVEAGKGGRATRIDLGSL